MLHLFRFIEMGVGAAVALFVVITMARYVTAVKSANPLTMPTTGQIYLAVGGFGLSMALFFDIARLL